MKLTVKSDEHSTSKTVDVLKLRTTDMGFRNFGLKLASGAMSLDQLGYAINFYLEDGPKKYKTPMYIETRFLSKVMKAIRADKTCDCGALILCSCHEKCDVCEPCEAGKKTAGVAMRLGSKITKAAISLNEEYDDKIENKIRDGWDED